MKLKQFLQLIDVMYFRMPAGRLDIPDSAESHNNRNVDIHILKEEFINSATSRLGKWWRPSPTEEEDTKEILEMMGPYALRNGLTKIPRSEQIGVAELALKLIDENSDSTQRHVNESSRAELTPESIIEAEGIASFLELIHPTYFRTPSVKAGFFSTASPDAYKKTSLILKAEFIEYVERQELATPVVLTMMGESATRNALQERLKPGSRGYVLPQNVEENVAIPTAKEYPKILINLASLVLVILGCLALAIVFIFLWGVGPPSG